MREKKRSLSQWSISNREVSGQQVRLQFQAGASSGQLTSKTGGKRPAHSLLINIVILANLTLLSTSVKEFLVLSFIIVYYTPSGCPKHLVNALKCTVNVLLASWLLPLNISEVFTTLADYKQCL